MRFNRLQAQYLEAIFEQIRGHQTSNSSSQHQNLHNYIADQFPSFGDFGNDQKYAGFVPSVSYLVMMMNKAIEIEEPDADQHTSCLAPAQLAIDDSHKVSPLFFCFCALFQENTYYCTQVNKHIAKIDGVPVFNALWTCMDQHYIRAQVLTLTKAHEERAGPLMAVARSVKKYGYDDPAIVFSDDPVKVGDIIQSLGSISDI
jgi:hypothetical protein